MVAPLSSAVPAAAPAPSAGDNIRALQSAQQQNARRLKTHALARKNPLVADLVDNHAALAAALDTLRGQHGTLAAKHDALAVEASRLGEGNALLQVALETERRAADESTRLADEALARITAENTQLRAEAATNVATFDALKAELADTRAKLAAALKPKRT